MTSLESPASPKHRWCREHCGGEIADNGPVTPQRMTLPAKYVKKLRLNIGGKVFATTVETLTRVQPSFFAAMFGGQYDTTPDEDGEFFIDRSYRHFDRSVVFFNAFAMD